VVAMIDTDSDLSPLCACVACFLTGRPVSHLSESGYTREFGAVWVSPVQLRVWDSRRGSYAHVGHTSGEWRLFDTATGQQLRIDRIGQQFTFMYDSGPLWFERVAVATDEVHTSGSDGEHCYGFA
jgi:hypothetical protein